MHYDSFNIMYLFFFNKTSHQKAKMNRFTVLDSRNWLSTNHVFQFFLLYREVPRKSRYNFRLVFRAFIMSRWRRASGLGLRHDRNRKDERGETSAGRKEGRMSRGFIWKITFRAQLDSTDSSFLRPSGAADFKGEFVFAQDGVQESTKQWLQLRPMQKLLIAVTTVI